MSAVTRIQAAWRGAASRKRTAVLLQRARQQRELLAQLHVALRAKQLRQAQSVAAQLAGEGCGVDVGRMVAELERQAAAASQALRNAAARGDAAEYSAAAAAAGQYADMEGQLQEAAAAFRGRAAAAERAVNEALEGVSAAVRALSRPLHGPVCVLPVALAPFPVCFGLQGRRSAS